MNARSATTSTTLPSRALTVFDVVARKQAASVVVHLELVDLHTLAPVRNVHRRGARRGLRHIHGDARFVQVVRRTHDQEQKILAAWTKVGQHHSGTPRQ